MTQDRWADVDEYFQDRLSTSDPILESVLDANAQGELPPIDVSPNQGKFLNLLARLINAQRILEIGTLGGYSTICLARALPDGGQIVTLELEPHHAKVAQRNFEKAGVGNVVDLRLGDALESLQRLVESESEPFDMVFVDADKERCAEYLEFAILLSRPGSLIIVDNVVRDGEIVNENSDDSRVLGVQAMIDKMSSDDRLTATMLQTVGIKGYDGFTIAIVE